MRYGFIGNGNMASAIIRGAVKSGAFAPLDIGGYDADAAKTQALCSDCGITACPSIEALAAYADILVLAVKPQVLPAVLPLLKPCCKGKCIATIAAGKPIAFYEEALGKIPVVRVMPNINAVVGAAASAVCANAIASLENVEAVRGLFKTVGTVIDLPESQFAIFSAISGASPAFAYIYIDALARAAVRAGMPREAALQAAASATFGSAKMVMESGEHPHLLADRVCSPGGTTIEGVHALKQGGFEGLVEDAVAAVIEKDNRL